MSIDPVTTDANTGSSFNRYDYANNNPYKYVDPDGRNPLLLVFLPPMAAGAAIGGGMNAVGQLISTGHIQWGGANGVLGGAVEGATFGMLGKIGAGVLSGGSPAARLPQDVKVNPTPPAALPTNRAIGTSPTQNAAAQADVAARQAAGHTDIRVNQQQVNADGVRVGVNRPDIQSTNPNGQREYVEYDRSGSNRGAAHESRLNANDPNGKVTLIKKD